MDLTPLTPLLLPLVGGTGLIGTMFGSWMLVRKAQFDRDVANHMADKAAFAQQVAAQETARGTVEVTRLTQETAQQQQDNVQENTVADSARGRIGTLEHRGDVEQQNELRMLERAVHAETRLMDMAHYAADLEEAFNLPRAALVADILMGTAPQPISPYLTPEGTVPIESVTVPVAAVAPIVPITPLTPPPSETLIQNTGAPMRPAH